MEDTVLMDSIKELIRRIRENVSGIDEDDLTGAERLILKDLIRFELSVGIYGEE